MNARIEPAAINLNDVALLVRVVQSHSFSAAARERGVPVSTVSRRIARLEAALGLRLLERTTRRLRLTEAGRGYFAHAERAVEDLARGASQVAELRTEPRGRVRVQAPIALGAAVATVVCSYLARYPGVAIDLELDERPLDLLAAEFDVAVITGKIDSTDFVAREIWRTTRKLLLASPRYLATRGAPRSVDDLARHDCIATRAVDGVATWPLAPSRGERRIRRVTFAPRFSVGEFGAAHRAVLAGLGIAMLPEVLTVADVAAGRLVRVLDGFEGEAGGVHLVYRAARSHTAAVRTCIDHFLAELPATDPSRAVTAGDGTASGRRAAAATASTARRRR